MIITRCPYRVSFFGGGTDFPDWYKKYGCYIVTCSIDAYCYITIRKLLPFYGKNYRVSWSEIEEVNEINELILNTNKGLDSRFIWRFIYETSANNNVKFVVIEYSTLFFFIFECFTTL